MNIRDRIKELRRVRAGDLRPHPKNWRKHPEEQANALRGILAEVGFVDALMVRELPDGALQIVDGHLRAETTPDAEVPVLVVDLDDKEAEKVLATFDPLGAMAEPDEAQLEALLKGIETDSEALAALLEQLADDAAKGRAVEVVEDDIPAPPDEATTKLGDLILLGEHRLLCGDSSKPEDVDRLLDGAVIHLVNSDPPYNVKVEPRSNNAIAAGLSSFTNSHHQGLDLARHPGKAKPTQKKLRAKDRPLANDFVTDDEFDRLLAAWFGNMARVLAPGRGFYIWGGYANCANYPPVLKACGLYFSQAVIWHKQHPVLTRKDFMGDHEWCQPPDTQVLTPEGSVSIRSLHDGDHVVSFSRDHGMLVGLKEGLGIKCTSRSYDGPLYEIVVGNRTTWCTGGHFWTVKLTSPATSLYCVYLMRRGSWWRVGKSKLLSTWGFGLKHRMFTEGGEDGWILSVHDSNAEAAVAEQLVATRYGIPTTFWRESPRSQRSAEQISHLYESLDLRVLANNAFRALEDHGRMLDHPFVTHGHTRPKYGCRVPLRVRACNLIPGIMAVPVPEGGQACRWEPLRAVDVQPYRGQVYSMHVDRYEHYVADGLVTHNCFYGWKEGAAHQFLGPNNVPDVWSVKKLHSSKMVHLTEKPVELAARAMQYSSRAGENVLDLFGGSGSTLMAAEQTGRKAFLMELDPLYADVIVERYEKFTGKKAERIGKEGGV
jgi:DNA modification methylase